ncbi:MAG: Lcl C-terminal domain-containing protein [Thermodesulfovibrionales bacterium]
MKMQRKVCIGPAVMVALFVLTAMGSLLLTGCGGGDASVGNSDCISDTYTGLCWDRSSSYPNADAYTGYNAQDYCTSAGGRLPTIDEYVVFMSQGTTTFSAVTEAGEREALIFGSIMNVIPAFEARGFDFAGGKALNYWSSTIPADEPGSLWSVSFENGLIFRYHMHNDTNYIRCVR